MKRFVVLSMVVAVALAGCSKPKTVVVLDSWWDTAQAKKACQTAKDWMQENQAAVTQRGCDAVKFCPQATKRTQACANDATGGSRAFEIKLAARFAADPACKDVEFAQIVNPNDTSAVSGDANMRWQLTLAFEPGAEKQVWTLEGPSSQYLKGTGAPENVAAQVCVAVGGTGARTAY